MYYINYFHIILCIYYRYYNFVLFFSLPSFFYFFYFVVSRYCGQGALLAPTQQNHFYALGYNSRRRRVGTKNRECVIKSNEML